ncbi:MAG: IclR family transcriptional regulator [Sphingomonas sp.]|uniref:IclR family transcriptional regulator n=1 Tax=Sphingomonas sp. TaxID=28214 RepID=UPI0025F70C90|nr:IclR family transcriptional regulator [Sphingomonas sp.]MBX3563552.1 IclR family transcriptional regulator [Sphingomonas sp.]
MSTVRGTQSATRVLDLLDAIAMDAGASSIAAIAESLELAPSTARRLVAALLRKGWIMRAARGRYMGGDRLRTLAARVSAHARLIEIARPVLRGIARELGCTAHLGMFENEMVTYLVKEGRHSVFTREHGQLEAYCTGIGKALLAQLPDSELETYLMLPLVRLTPHTIVEPDTLRLVLDAARIDGFALDDREMHEALCCVGVPLALPGEGWFAISVSGDPGRFGPSQAPAVAPMLQARARIIAERFARPVTPAGTARHQLEPQG